VAQILPGLGGGAQDLPVPENWLEPELRDNKSLFFKELEDGLYQDDVNLDTAERLYRIT